MATLKDTVALTSQLNELASELNRELTDGDVDFEKLVDLADRISEHADSLAGAFSRVNDALTEPLEHNGDGSDSTASGHAQAGSTSHAPGSRSSSRSTSRASRSRTRRNARSTSSSSN